MGIENAPGRPFSFNLCEVTFHTNHTTREYIFSQGEHPGTVADLESSYFQEFLMGEFTFF